MAIALALLAAIGLTLPIAAQSGSSTGRFLAQEDILLFGLGLKIEPAQQTVPTNIATIVSTMFVAPQTPQNLPAFAPDALVKGTLRGPTFPTAIELTATPNSPFNIPPLTVAGRHTLDNIRLVSNGEVVLRGTPESTVIDVIDRLLITEVTARPLTAAEIREKGLVFDKSSFQAYNFAAAFAIEDRKVPINFTVVLPTLLGASDVAPTEVRLAGIGSQTGLPSLQTVIPDSLKRLQTQIPNLNVQGFTLKVPNATGQNFFVPPIPGVVVIPGDIGFLNQFFSVMLMVGNVAPAGSNLVVTDLKAEIVLPPGIDTVVGSPDDPLRMGRTDRGEVPRIQSVIQPGPDGVLGTADDVVAVGPGETGNAEFLVEGRREGSHIIEMEITGTLLGLPIGPVTVRGRALGAVLVRNPTFTLTFTHPEVVAAGEAYTLDVTVTNTSESPANFVTLNLYPKVVSGATIVGEPTRQIETIAPGDSESVSYDLIAKVSGKVIAATLDSDENVTGRFALKTSVGELGIPLSPDSLVLPKEAGSLPLALRTAAIGLLGKAYAVATAPGAALPKDIQRFSKKLIWDRAIEVAAAGLRVGLHESMRDTASQLLMDFIGSGYARLADRISDPEDLAFARDDLAGFDDLRRRSSRGDVFAQSVAALLTADLASAGAAAFHQDVARKISYRPAHISVLISGGTTLPVRLTLVDAAGRRLGGVGVAGKITKEIPFGDYLQFATPGSAPTAQMAMIAAPVPGAFTIRLERVAGVPDSEPYTLSVVVPDGQGQLRQFVFQNASAAQVPELTFAPADPYRLSVEAVAAAGAPLPPSITAIADPPPSIVGVVQQGRADQVCVDPGKTEGLWRPGRIVAVLFSEEVTLQSVQDKFKAEDINHFLSDGNKIVGVALQPDGRIAFLAFRDPVGPFLPRTITIQDVADLRGQAMSAETAPIEITAEDDGGVVSGRVLRADGSPVPFASMRLFYGCPKPEGGVVWIGISSKSADANGKYSWDYVLRSPRILAVDPETDEFRDLQFNIARNGQKMNVDIVLLGRGTLQGRTLGEDGKPLKDTAIRISSLTDNSAYGATSDADGRFTVARVPVGNVFIEAVNTVAKAQISISETIPFAGATTTRDLVLLTAESPKEISIKRGVVSGHVTRSDGTGSLAGLPVIVYYIAGSQTSINCGAGVEKCPVAIGKTDADGAFAFAGVPAGQLRVQSFDPATRQEGEAAQTLAADGHATLTVVITGGLGSVKGVVLDPAGHGVANARVGGGLSLTTTDASGHFTLPDVPLGQRDIVAVSDALGSSASVTVDITHAGEQVPATIVLESVGRVAGTIFRLGGATPVPGIAVYLYKLPIQHGRIEIVGEATTDEGGHYQMPAIPVGRYRLSAFTANFSDGNLAEVSVKFNNQTVKGDVIFRGGGLGQVTGTVLDASSTPVKARVSLSGEQLTVAGGRVGITFEYIQNFKIVDTDFSTGAFAMGGLWPGTFTIRAAGAFSPDPISLEATMPSPPTTIDLTLKLQPTSQVTGRILKPDGTPVDPGVIVKYKSDEFKTFCVETSGGEMSCVTIPQGIQEAIEATDTDGTFLFPLVNAGNYTLTVFETSDPNSRTARIRGAVRAGEKAEVSITLPAVADLIVKVFASDAQTLIPGARVTVKQIDYPNRQITLFTGQAGDERGIARFSGGDAFSAGAFVVSAVGTQQDGFAGVASGNIVNDGEAVTLSVYLATATGAVHGTVRRPDNSPAPNAEVVISNQDGAIGFTVTDATGSFAQDLIPLGKFTIDAFEASNAGHGAATGEIFLANQDVPVHITEDALAVVTGRVVQSGTLAPLKGWQVALSQRTASGRSMSLRTTSGIDGGFSFPGAAVGTFELRADKHGVQGSTTANNEITRPGQAVDVPLVVSVVTPSFGRLEGVVSYANGTPVGNAQVCVGVCDPFVPMVTAGADGSYAVEQLPLGRTSVTARPQTGFESGSAVASIDFDGDTARAEIILAGLSTISGTVLFNGAPVPGAKISLSGIPLLTRSGFADTTGHFSFSEVSARSFTIIASAPPAYTTKGVVSERLNAGEARQVEIVLEPTGALSGRVLLESTGTPAVGITAELVVDAKHLFTETIADGTFTFDTVPLGPYTLTLQDPIGTGVASKTGTLAGISAIGDIRLDAASPVVAETIPASAATGVAKNATVRVVTSEPIDPATVTTATVTLSDSAGAVAGNVVQSDGDTVITFRPLVALKEQTKYSLRVTELKDRVGHAMKADYVAAFTTADTIAPTTVSISPAPATPGVSIFSPIRITFDEAIDPAKFRTPVALTLSTAGAAVAGRLDFLFGNTVVVFTPNLPLAGGETYRLQAPAAVDLSSNTQAQGLDFTFSTTTGAPPVISQLVAANNGAVIENTATSATATVGAFDVAFVDFFLNDQFAATLPAPFVFNFQAIPSLGAPGDQIKVSAIATDTSGNRGVAPVSTLVTITPDLPPAAVISVPPASLTASNGEHVAVTIRATDDVGVVQVSFKAETGKPLDAATRPVAPAVLDRTEAFGFIVPASAVPGSALAIQASAIDTKGQVIAATPLIITVRDAVAPTVTITGATSGTQVRAGQQTTVIVSVQDAGSVRSITFKASGVAALTQTRIIDPPQSSIVTSFVVSVPVGAKPPQSLTLDATAEDRAGNVGSAARVILPVVDNVAPTVTALRTDTGRLQIVRARSVTILIDAEDDLGVSEIGLRGDGAFTVTEAKAIAPPLGAAAASFTIQVPAGAIPGAVLNLQATAKDLSGNSSAPVALALTVTALPEVTFGPSVIVKAGESANLALQLSEAAPAGGQRVDIATDGAIATTTPFVLIAAGESDATITVTGVAGGTTFVNALIQGVQRGSATIVVEGGIVTGTVLDPQLAPVAGAKISLTEGPQIHTAETDAAGRYRIQGIFGPSVSVKVLKDVDPSTRLLGFGSGVMNRIKGFVNVDVVLVAAGVIHGPVLLADGTTPAPDGVQIDLIEGNGSTSISTTFSANGVYEFPLVGIGKYTIESSDTAGNRGRAAAEIVSSGQDVAAPIAFLGRGSVTVTVEDGAGNTVNGAVVTVFGYSIFGGTPPITGTAVAGIFTVGNMFLGTFTVQARDPSTNQAASLGGELTAAAPHATKVLKLSSFGGLQGTVYRSDAVTTVSGATVTAFGINTVTDTQGRYSLAFLPLGTSSVFVREPATRGFGSSTVTLDQQGATKTVDVKLHAQGTLVVTVQTANGVPVPGVGIVVQAGTGAASDVLFAQSGDGGVVLVNHVIVGPFSVRAVSGSLSGTTLGTLSAGEQRPVLVKLEPTASIAGIVRAPNDAPATAGQVLGSGSRGSFTVPIAADGTFRADNLNLGSYTLVAYDADGRVRARITSPIVLAVPNQVANASMKFVGLGTVVGRVFNPDGSSAIGLSVQVRSLNPDFGGYRPGESTNQGGFYLTANVPVGEFTVSVAKPLLQLRGEGSGTIQQDGSVATVDILLQNNLIDLPVSRWDANNFLFDLQKDGSILSGKNQVFGGVSGGTTWGAMQLEIVAGGTAARFTGADFGTVEDKSREIVVSQDNVGGLNVTRKVFVPAAGYFTRYLEVLTNPTTAPVTVNVRISSHILRASGTDPGPAIVATSSGDDQLDVSDPELRDRWVVIDDMQEGDPFVVLGLPATAFVFDGAAGTRAVGEALFGPSDSPVLLAPRALGYQWSAITIAPNETIALMHFAAQQTSRPAAQGAAARLLQLPPEALAGLSVEELAHIENFAIPGGGVSALPSLAPLTGAIGGRALASDATTPVAGVPVQFQSGNILFGRTYQTTSGADGSFAFASAMTENGTSRAIPVDGFTLRADHPSLGSLVPSPPATGVFASGLLTSQQDVVFSNTGVSRGVVRLNGVPVAGATVAASAPFAGSVVNFSTQTSSTGDYAFALLPPAPFTFTATSTQQGVTVRASRAAGVVAGQTGIVDLGIDTVPPQLSIVSPAATVEVDPRNPLTVTVQAADAGGVIEMSIAASGATFAAETRAIAPATTLHSDTFSVPFTALPPTGGTVTLTATARDEAGNQGSAAPVTVTVRDVVAPDVVMVTPQSGLAAVEPDASMTVQFSEPIDRSTVTTATLRLMSGGVAVPITFGFSNGDRTVALVAAPLKLNTTFTIQATSAITDAAGNPLLAALSSTFRTKSPDTIPPTVSAIAPAHNAVNVPVGTDIRVSFTEPIEVATITAATFRVSVAGTPIAGHFTFADNNATVRFAPDAPLPFDAVVISELTAGITDLFENALVDGAGQAITTPLTFTFLTGTFGITRPTQGSEVLEHAPLTLEAKASASLNITSMTFVVNGQALPAVAGPPFLTTYNVGAAAAAPMLTIVATGRNAAGTQIAQDQVVVTVLTGLRSQPRLVGVPLGGTGLLRLGLPTPLTTDLTIQLSVVDTAIATVPSASVVLAAGQTEVVVPVSSVSIGATTIAATSSRGNTWAIAAVSPVVAKTISGDGAPVGVVVVPARLLGHVFVAVAGQQTLVVPILRSPSVADLPVVITSSNGAVASVPGAVSIAQGGQSATITIVTGVAGTTTLTIRAGSEFGQLSVVVGNPPPGTEPPTVAAPVGVVLLAAASAGRLFTSPGGQSTFGVTVLSTAAAASTPVTVTSSDPGIASVLGSVTVAAGSQIATVTVVTGVQGTATLTFRAGSESREVTLVVGPPAPGTEPPTVASPVGVVLLAAPSAGRLITSPATQSAFTLQLLASPATAATPVTVTSSDANVASVSGPIEIAAGARAASVTILTGVEGSATLTFRAGTETRELTIVVGTPAPGTEPPVIASPVGVVLLQQRLLGTVFTPTGGQPTVTLTLLASPADAPTAVTITSSDVNVASVTGTAVVAAGARTVALDIVSGVTGVATVTLRAGNDVAQIIVVVGTPPAALIPVITAPIVGIEVKQ
jgi:hypothetical protein